MLRDKANFSVLEGLITVLLNEPVKIVEIMESEANQDTDTIHRLRSLGLSVEQIALGAGMSVDEVKKLLK
jgi:predicted transposase YdaD